MCRKWTALPKLLLARPRSISAHALWSRDRSVRMRCDMTLSHGLNWPIFDQWEHRTTKTNPNYRHEVIDGVLFKMDRRSEFRVWKKLSHKIFFLFFLMFQIKTSHFNAVTCRTGATSDHVRDKWPVYRQRTRQVTAHKAGRLDGRTDGNPHYYICEPVAADKKLENCRSIFLVFWRIRMSVLLF